jgi:hypothetical protein
MDWILVLAIFLIVYGLAVLAIAWLKPPAIWNMGKIQGFVKLLTETGTVIFFYVWGIAALIVGIVLL